MLAASASLLNVKVVILDAGEHVPAKQIIAPSTPSLRHIDGSFSDPTKIRELAEKVDVLTVEIEHVDAHTLEEIQASGSSKLAIHPSPATIRIIQDKFNQKEHLSSHGCPISEYTAVESTAESIHAAAQRLGLPLMLKSRTLAYDGRGNYVIRDLSQTEAAIAALGSRPLYAEKWVSFAKEIAIMVVRTTAGEVQSYPVVETVHKENICHLVFAPLRSRDPLLESRARLVAEQAIKSLSGAGVFGVEMFLMENGALHDVLVLLQLIFIQVSCISMKLPRARTTRGTTLSKHARPRSTKITSAPSCPCLLDPRHSRFHLPPCSTSLVTPPPWPRFPLSQLQRSKSQAPQSTSTAKTLVGRVAKWVILLSWLTRTHSCAYGCGHFWLLYPILRLLRSNATHPSHH